MEQIPRNDDPPAPGGVNQNQQPPEKVSVDAATFGAKYQSKREVFRFLTHDCGCFLPSYESCTIFHMRDIAGGKRRRLKAKIVKQIFVPNFERLTIDTML